MKSLSLARGGVFFVSVVCLVIAGAWVTPAQASTPHSTIAGSLVGEGGDAMGPVVNKLLHDDAAGLSPDLGTYTNVDIDQGIADFVGSGPGSFAADFAVAERPLTSAEQAKAKANGRTYAYVPYAATPVSLMTLVVLASQATHTTTNIDYATDLCQHVPLTLGQLDGIYGAPPYSGWGDANLFCSTQAPAPAACTALAAPTVGLSSNAFYSAANLDPTMENYSLMTLLDSTTPSKTAFQAALTAAVTGSTASTSNPAPSESWPYTGKSTPSGDQQVLGKLVGLNPQTDLPSTASNQVQLGGIVAMASDWTGAPLGEQWNLPTAAIQNANGQFVWPCSKSAAAAEADAALAQTTDPTTNNLVTFDPTNTTDAAAYNSDLMLESYLVVPLNGLSADKANALAQLVRFVVGGNGQTDISSLGAAPATKAMVTADLAVAQQLNAEAAAAPSSSSTTASSSSSSTTTTTAAGSTTSTTSGSTTGNTGALATGASTSPGSGGLAVTGGDPLPLVVLGVVLLAFGETARRVVRRRRRVGT